MLALEKVLVTSRVYRQERSSFAVSLGVDEFPTEANSSSRMLTEKGELEQERGDDLSFLSSSVLSPRRLRSRRTDTSSCTGVASRSNADGKEEAFRSSASRPSSPSSLAYSSSSSSCSPVGNELLCAYRSSLHVRSVVGCSTFSRARSCSSSSPVLVSSYPHPSFSSAVSAKESGHLGRSLEGEEEETQQTETECGKRRDRGESSRQEKEHDEVHFLHECVRSSHLFLYCFTNLR